MQKVKDGEVHKVKDDVTREVIGGMRVGAVKTKVFIRAVGKPLDVAKVVQKLHKVKDMEVHKVKDLVTR